MKTETLKLNIVQQIIDLSDLKVLEKIRDLLKSESIVGYRVDGTPITKSQFMLEMTQQQEKINNGTAQFYTIDEVRKMVLDDNNLGK